MSKILKIIENEINDKVTILIEIDTKELIFSNEVRKYCQLNHCGKYNQNWMCPPGVGSLSFLKDKYSVYKKAIIFNRISNLSDPYDIEGMDKGRKEVEEILHDLKLSLNKYIDDFQILGVGGCNICDVCTYPSSECRFPSKAIPSLEAIGIDVVQIANKFDLKYNNGKNTVTYFGMVLYDSEKKQ